MTPVPKYVTIEECKNKLHLPKWVCVLFISVVIGICTLFLGLVTYSESRASAAATNSADAIKKVENITQETKILEVDLRHYIETQKQVQLLRDKAFSERLEAICQQLKEQKYIQQNIENKLQTFETILNKYNSSSP